MQQMQEQFASQRLTTSGGRASRSASPARTRARAATRRDRARAADDLQPDGQTLRREAARHADRRRAQAADRIAARHPIDVRVHRARPRSRAATRSRPGTATPAPWAARETRTPRRTLRRARRAPPARARHARDRPASASSPCSMFQTTVSLSCGAAALEVAAQRSRISGRAQRLEQLVDAVKVGLAVVHLAAELRRNRSARRCRPPSPPAPRDSGRAARSRRRACPRSRAAARRETPLPGSGSDNASRASGPAITDSSSARSSTSARHRPVHAERVAGARVQARHAARRRPEADDVAEARGIAQRAAEIRAVGERQHAARERDGRAAAAAAASLAVGRTDCAWRRTTR